MTFFQNLFSSDNWLDIFLLVVFVIWCVVRIILAIVEFKSSHDVKTLNFNLKEICKDMSKFRLPDYQEDKKFDKSTQRQKFSKYSPEYVYNEDTEELKATGGKIDNQAVIESYLDTCFEKVLEKFLPELINKAQPDSDGVYGDSTQIKQDLADFASMLDVAEDYRDKYKLSDDLNAIEVFEAVKKLSDEQTAYVKGVSDKNVKKGSNVDVNALKNVFKAVLKEESDKGVIENEKA